MEFEEWARLWFIPIWVCRDSHGIPLYVKGSCYKIAEIQALASQRGGWANWRLRSLAQFLRARVFCLWFGEGPYMSSQGHDAKGCMAVARNENYWQKKGPICFSCSYPLGNFTFETVSRL